MPTSMQKITEKKTLLSLKVKALSKNTCQWSYQARRLFVWKKVLQVFKE